MYNEADRIADCLEAIARQDVRPYEVIVVDNNSTDGTAAIAARFPFVTLLRESRQGVVYARAAGFDKARGEIIGRIDSDTLLPPDWVRTLQRIFTESDLDAVAGRVTYSDIALAKAVSRVDLAFRRYFARVLGRYCALQGANMGIRRSAWQNVRTRLCMRSNMHEDFDLAIHLVQQGHTVQFDESLTAAIGSRQCASDWRGFASYAAISPRTYDQHGLSTRYMWRVVILVVMFYPVLRFLHQGYDADQQKFTLSSWLRGGTVARVNPATFVE